MRRLPAQGNGHGDTHRIVELDVPEEENAQKSDQALGLYTGVLTGE